MRAASPTKLRHGVRFGQLKALAASPALRPPGPLSAALLLDGQRREGGGWVWPSATALGH